MGLFCKSVFHGSPPDGGWSWVVLFASFMNIFMMDGVVTSYGVFFQEYRSHFQSNKNTTSIPLSLLLGLYLLLGPLAGAFIRLFGFRKVAVTGSLLFAAEIFFSTFCSNIESFIFVYGVIGGTGLGLMYLPTIMAINMYFHKKRTIVTGIALCGAGTGTLVFSSLGERLLNMYGRKGATWVLAGMILNCVAFSSTYRPIESSHSSVDESVVERAQKKVSKQACMHKTFHNNAHVEAISYIKILNAQDNNSCTLNVTDEITSDHIAIDRGRTTLPICDTNDMPCTTRASIPHDDNARTINLTSAPRWKNQRETPLRFDASAITKKDKSCMTRIRFVEVMKYLKYEMCQVRVMKNSSFVLFACASFTFGLGYPVPFIFLPDMVQDLSVSSGDAAYLISIIGISSIIGHVAAGFIAHSPCTDSNILMSSVMIVGGIASIFLPLWPQYWIMVGFCVIFGAITGAVILLGPVVCIRIGGIENLSSTFGFISMLYGVSMLMAGPIAGSIADYTGNYNATFYFTGACFIVGGACCFLLTVLTIIRKRETVQ